MEAAKRRYEQLQASRGDIHSGHQEGRRSIVQPFGDFELSMYLVINNKPKSVEQEMIRYSEKKINHFLLDYVTENSG